MKPLCKQSSCQGEAERVNSQKIDESQWKKRHIDMGRQRREQIREEQKLQQQSEIHWGQVEERVPQEHEGNSVM